MTGGGFGLGVDGGGSATRWVLWGAGGRVAGGALPAVSGHLFNPEERARFADMVSGLARAIAPFGPVRAVVAGITGISSTAPEAASAVEALAAAARVAPAAVRVEDDIWIAYHAAFAPGTGILVYAGTGSIGVHIRADGTVVRVGGRGALIDDAGSAFWLGRAALDIVYRVLDERPEVRFTLVAELFAAIGGEDWDIVRAYVYGGGRNAVAQLALAVARAAELGDGVAIELLTSAGRELARLARALAAREGDKPVALLGRAAGLSPLILSAMQAEAAPLEISRRDLDAATTAARLAFERQG